MSVGLTYAVSFGREARRSSRGDARSEARGREPADAGGTGAAPERRVSRAARMLALAHRIERLVEEGELAGYAEAGRRLGLTRARLTQVMNLLQLSPLIQESLASGELELTERRLRSLAKIPEWTAQQSAVSSMSEKPPRSP